jgi:activator of 2-hydroxyglutaryl-CoA dehydratase
MALFLDAGTTYSKIISTSSDVESLVPVKVQNRFNYYIIESKMLRDLNLNVKAACGHMTGSQIHENEIIALAKGAKKYIDNNATVLDLGSRDAKWITFKDGKFHDMDWNTSCASSTGATVEMLLKFYDLNVSDLKFNPEKFNITCGIFGLEKIMDSISKGDNASDAVSKFVHGIAYNAWNFAKKPNKLYLSGGFCENKCLVESLQNYCDVVLLGRFVLCEGLIDE